MCSVIGHKVAVRGAIRFIDFSTVKFAGYDVIIDELQIRFPLFALPLKFSK